jgi:hypothetical protein
MVVELLQELSRAFVKAYLGNIHAHCFAREAEAAESVVDALELRKQEQ